MDQDRPIPGVDDITHGSFEEFVGYLFAHELHASISFDPLKTIKFYIQLFNQSTVLFGKYDREQLERGFWTIQSVAENFSIGFLIGDSELPLELRLECIKATYKLFEDFFSVDILVNSGGMWWDCILDGYQLKLSGIDEAQDRLIRNTVFDTLSHILQLASLDCQGSALHGLGHLHHPNTETVVMAYLDAHPELDEDMQDFALDCITGDIM